MKKSWKWVIVCALCSVGVALFVQPFWYEFGAVMGLTAKGIAWILVVVGVGHGSVHPLGALFPPIQHRLHKCSRSTRSFLHRSKTLTQMHSGSCIRLILAFNALREQRIRSEARSTVE